MQRKILLAMRDGDPVAFTGEGSRVHGFRISEARYGGFVVCAYGTPAYFLNSRGLIAPAERNVPGYWYRITEKGRAAVGAS